MPPETANEGHKQAQDAVFHALHAQLRSKEKRPVLASSDDAVWVTWRVDGHGPLEYRIDDPQWHRADPAELAGRLLAGIREALRRHQEAHGS